MELKDKLNLLWKYLFLAVFTYAVINLTCCNNKGSSCCGNKSGQVSPCGLNKQPTKVVDGFLIQPCDTNCNKPCCANKGIQ